MTTTQQEERLKNWKAYPDQRGYFARELYKQMAENPDIWLLCMDLGYNIFDNHFQDFPERTINTGASEAAAMGIAVGLTLKGKTVFVYSITTFLLRRPYETIKLYIDEEKVPVILCGSGRDKDYHIDGASHYAADAKALLGTLPNIVQYWPEDKKEIADMIKKVVSEKKPAFISLKR
jgi:transketolase